MIDQYLLSPPSPRLVTASRVVTAGPSVFRDLLSWPDASSCELSSDPGRLSLRGASQHLSEGRFVDIGVRGSCCIRDVRDVIAVARLAITKFRLSMRAAISRQQRISSDREVGKAKSWQPKAKSKTLSSVIKRVRLRGWKKQSFLRLLKKVWLTEERIGNSAPLYVPWFVSPKKTKPFGGRKGLWVRVFGRLNKCSARPCRKKVNGC